MVERSNPCPLSYPGLESKFYIIHHILHEEANVIREVVEGLFNVNDLISSNSVLIDKAWVVTSHFSSSAWHDTVWLDIWNGATIGCSPLSFARRIFDNLFVFLLCARRGWKNFPWRI